MKLIIELCGNSMNVTQQFAACTQRQTKILSR